jgi:putative MFS transporter
LISGAGLASGVSPNYTFLIICRATVGFGVGGAVVPFDLLAEFLPNNHRGKFLIYIEGFWTVGSIFVAGVAWWMLSSGGWRLLTIITAIPVTCATATTVTTTNITYYQTLHCSLI